MKEERLSNDLARIHDQINNCDNKLSIILGSTLTVVTLVLSFFKEEICHSASDPLTLFTLVISLSVLSFGIYSLLKGLIGRLEYQNDSVPDSNIYFRKIAEKSYREYSEKIRKSSDRDYFEDLLAQIHATSCICKLKFDYYNRGITICSIGWVLLLALVIVCHLG